MPTDMHAIQDVIQKIAERNQYATTQETIFLDELRADLLAIFERGEGFDRLAEQQRELHTLRRELKVEKRAAAMIGRRLVELVDLLKSRGSVSHVGSPCAWSEYQWKDFTKSVIRHLTAKAPSKSPTPSTSQPGPLRWLIRKILYGVKA